jgi:gas vesicle protein GvpG
MLLVDDILLSPITSILWIFREIHNAMQQELTNESEAITAELGDLYMMLETGKITEEEFDAREKALLDRLDQLQGQPPETIGEFDPDGESEQSISRE